MASSAQMKAFIEQIAPIVQAEAMKRGYKVCSPIIAQACCESAYGTSWISKSPYFNFFGMKCGKSWKGRSVSARTKEEYQKGVLTSIVDNFRAFDSIRAGIEGYFLFISSNRYKNLMDAKTPQEYLELIKKDGYATSSTYVSTNMAIINRHDLTKFDTISPPKDEKGINPYTLAKKVIKRGDIGESVKWLQWELNQHDANLKIDGIFGKNTELSVVLYQKAHRLAQDGIAGKYTINSLKGC